VKKAIKIIEEKKGNKDEVRRKTGWREKQKCIENINEEVKG